MDCLCHLIICLCHGLKPRANQGDCNMKGTKLKIPGGKRRWNLTYRTKFAILLNFESPPTPFPVALKYKIITESFFSPSSEIHPLVFPNIFSWLAQAPTPGESDPDMCSTRRRSNKLSVSFFSVFCLPFKSTEINRDSNNGTLLCHAKKTGQVPFSESKFARRVIIS